MGYVVVMAQQQQTAALSALKDNPQATVHTIEMIQQIERGELPIEDVMQMQRDFEKEQAAATRAPFPTEEATKVLATLQEATALDQINLDTLQQMVGWASEDTYREQLFEQGAVPVFVHSLTFVRPSPRRRKRILPFVIGLFGVWLNPCRAKATCRTIK